MRQRLQHKKQNAERETRDSKRGTSFPESMAEGITGCRDVKKFTMEEVQLINMVRGELTPKGLTDSEIARELAERMGRSEGGVREKMRHMLKTGKLAPNPNRREEFSDAEVARIIELRQTLITNGMGDSAIAAEIAPVLDRTKAAALRKIQKLVKCGVLPQNPNNRKLRAFAESERSLIVRRYQELAALGLKDTEIADMVSSELQRSVHSIHTALTRLRKGGAIPANPNKVTRNAVCHADHIIIRMREELANNGLLDCEIAAQIAGETGLCADSVRTRISGLMKTEKLEKNQNWEAPKDFGASEIGLISRRRVQLVAEGYSETAASAVIAGELGRTQKSVESKIRKLLRHGKLRKLEKGKASCPFSEQETGRLLEARSRLIPLGLKDSEIAVRVAVELGRPKPSINHKISGMVRAGAMETNPNRLRKKGGFTPGDLSFLASERGHLIGEGFTDSRISKEICGRLGRASDVVEGKIIKMVRAGLLPPNPNRRKAGRISKEALERLKASRAKLMADGLCDAEIAERIAPEFRRSPRSMHSRLLRLVKKGLLARNPFSPKPFSGDELRLVTELYRLLVDQGLSNKAIARMISNELSERTTGSIERKLQVLIVAGRLPENPNKRIVRQTTENDIHAGLSQAALAMEKFGGEEE